MLCLYCSVWVAALRQGWSPAQGVLPTVCKIHSSRLIWREETSGLETKDRRRWRRSLDTWSKKQIVLDPFVMLWSTLLRAHKWCMWRSACDGAIPQVVFCWCGHPPSYVETGTVLIQPFPNWGASKINLLEAVSTAAIP
jgi:hypothetical protein